MDDMDAKLCRRVEVVSNEVVVYVLTRISLPR